ncbi:MAG TPA: ABC transporter permease [Candidatus Saccharimonadia bacterium]|nr:ABC transporter permease [Candidatus Saccharimonadia bacterium]
MLGFRDTFVLATTKLRVHRLRLAVTILVAGLLFTSLVAGSLVVRGTTQSLETFSGDGLLHRFITNIITPFNYDTYSDPRYVARTAQLDTIRLAAQSAAAKRLGLEFDPKTAAKGVSEPGGPSGTTKSININEPTARQAFLELTPDTMQQNIAGIAKKYHATATYESTSLGFSAIGPDQYGFSIITGGQEQRSENPGFNAGQDPILSFQNLLSAFDNNLLKPFLLPGVSLDAPAGKPVPILAPIGGAEKLLTIKPLSSKASAKAQIQRLDEIRTRSKDLVFDVCYRNKAALDLLRTATQQTNEIVSHKTDSTYQKPSLIYAPTNLTCQPTHIASDTRTAAERTQAAKEDQFAREFGAEAPITQRLSFRIVGILPNPGTLASASGPQALLAGFVTTSLGEGWFTSREAATANPVLGPIVSDRVNKLAGIRNLYLEFANRTDQKHFIDDKNCNPENGNPASCTKDNKFLITPFGNPLASLYEIGQKLNTFFQIAIGIVALVSAIILVGTIGKVIADSRKETSVFRAVGAKRLDIAQIYLLYAGMLASLAFGVALILGLLVGWYLESHYSPGLSAEAVLSFNTRDLTKTFHVIGFNLGDMAIICAFIITIALASAIVPILANLRRNPIKDMREE